MPNAEDKISRAVQLCIARCDGKTPIGVIAEFLAELRQQGWSESEIRQVETAARRNPHAFAAMRLEARFQVTPAF